MKQHLPPIIPPSIIGKYIQLELLNDSHEQGLYEAAQHEAIWVISSSNAFGDKFAAYFQKALTELQQKKQIPYVVRRLSDQKILGSTRFYDIDESHKRLVIGYTWYMPEVWGTYVNRECKLLMLATAFEIWNINRVESHIDSRNARSLAISSACARIKFQDSMNHLHS